MTAAKDFLPATARPAPIPHAWLQALALQDLGRALAAREDEAALDAFYLAWVEWRTIDNPNAEPLAQLLSSVMPGFDGQQIDPELVAACRDAVQAAVARCPAELDTAGIDPLSPLSEE